MDQITEAPTAIRCQHLTTWAVQPGGAAVSLGLAGHDGEPYRLVLPVEALTALLMTLPRMLRTALEERAPNGGLRVVYPLGKWDIEQCDGARELILNLRTPDGFEAAFTLNEQNARDLGAALLRAPDAMDPTSTRDLH